MTRTGTFNQLVLPSLAAGQAWNTIDFLAGAPLTVINTQPPVIRSATLVADDRLRLAFSGPAGLGYEVRASTNITLSPVTLCELIQTGSFGSNQVLLDDAIVTNRPQRFYRIRIP